MCDSDYLSMAAALFLGWAALITTAWVGFIMILRWRHSRPASKVVGADICRPGGLGAYAEGVGDIDDAEEAEREEISRLRAKWAKYRLGMNDHPRYQHPRPD